MTISLRKLLSLVAVAALCASPALAQQRSNQPPAQRQGQAQPAPQAQPNRNLVVVRLSYASGWDALPAIVGMERGFFANEGLVVSGMPVSSGLAVIRSIGVGSTDFAAVPQRVFLTMAGANVEAKAVAVAGWGTEMEVIVPTAATNVKTLADLKGKIIALGGGSDAHPILVRLLNAAKMRPQDVKIAILEPVDLTSVFEKKLADAVIETRHFTEVLRSTNQGRVLMSNDQITAALGRIDAKALVVRNGMIATEPDTVQRVVNAWIRSLLYIQQDPRDAARLMTIFFHRQGVVVQPQQAEHWVTFTKYNRYVWGQAEVTDAEYNGWGLTNGQLLKQVPKLQPFVENRFAEAAVKNLQTARAGN
jgi:NitT/TauT family transport system substrate-binding protein